MVAFSERPFCYQLAVLLLLLATSLFAAGVALPWWAQTRGHDDDVITSHSGLWQGCSSSPDGDVCSAIDAPAWFKAVQGLQCLALAGMVVACVYAIFTNCCLDHATFSRTMEVAAGSGGLLGIASTLLYLAKTSHILRQSRDVSYSYAFGMDVAACVFVTFIAAIIALSNSRHGDETTSHFIFEEDSGYHRPGSWVRQRGRGKKEWEMEMTPVRTPQLPATPGAEVIVLQNNYSVDSQRPAVEGMESGSSGAFSKPTCVCHPQWKTGVSAGPGHGGGAHASCHGHCCKTRYPPPPDYSADGPPPFQTTGCSCTSMPMGPSPAVHSNATYDPKRFSNSLFPPAAVTGCACSGADTALSHSESQYCQQNSDKFVHEQSAPVCDTDMENYPRVVATAPPLSLQTENVDHIDYAATAQYFVSSGTVCVGEDSKRGY